MMVRLLLELFQLVREGVLALHRQKKLCAREGIPVGRYDRSSLVFGAEHSDDGRDLFVRAFARVAENDTTRVLHLVVEEFAEVLHIHLALVDVNDGREAVESRTFSRHTFDRADDVGQLTDARGLDQNAVGGKFLQHLFECLTEVADERAADTARVHLGDLNACVLHKAAIDADLAEFVFDQNELFARIGFLDELFQKSSLAGSEKAGDNIDFCHKFFLSGIYGFFYQRFLKIHKKLLARSFLCGVWGRAPYKNHCGSLRTCPFGGRCFSYARITRSTSSGDSTEKI